MRLPASAARDDDRAPAFGPIDAPRDRASPPAPGASPASLAPAVGSLRGAALASLAAALLISWPILALLRGAKFHWSKGASPETTPRSRCARWAQDLRDVRAFTRVYAEAMFGPEPRPATPLQRGRPIVAVHGLCGSRNNWTDYAAELGSQGRPFYCRTLGRPGSNLDQYTAKLGALVDEVLQQDHGAGGVDLIAHSMGGVIVRDLLLARPDLAGQVRSIVTIASPHAGTDAALYFPILPEARLLSTRSRWLSALPMLRDLAPNARILTLVGEDDPVVYPVHSALCAGTERRMLAGQGHFTLLYDREVIREVVAYLEASPTKSGALDEPALDGGP